MYATNIGFPDGPVVKILSVMPEMWFQPLGQEESQEKEMATHSSIFVWEIPRIEESGRTQSMGSQKGQTQLSD